MTRETIAIEDLHVDACRLIRTVLIDGMKRRGARYVFASDHSLSTNVDYDDFRHALDVYRECVAY